MMVSATDKSVRDNSQRAIVKNNKITVISYFGRKKVGEYTFNISEWEMAERHHTFNSSYNRTKMITGKFNASFPQNQENQEPFNGRLIDSQIAAINAVYRKIKAGEQHG